MIKLLATGLVIGLVATAAAQDWKVIKDGAAGTARIVESREGKSIGGFMPEATTAEIVAAHNAAALRVQNAYLDHLASLEIMREHAVKNGPADRLMKIEAKITAVRYCLSILRIECSLPPIEKQPPKP